MKVTPRLVLILELAATLWVAGPGIPGTARSQTADTFNPSASDVVLALAVQADGRVVAGGVFTTLGGATRQRLGRLNPDGTLDTAFYPSANNSVNCLAIQADGKILVGGLFNNLAGQPRNYLGRLNANGSLDASFNPGTSGNVNAIVIQPDGNILVAGAFTNLAGQPCKGLGRLFPDGTLDASFNPDVGTEIYTVALQPDGMILVGGTFTTLAGAARSRVGRLDANGGVDFAFNPGASGAVRCLVVQPDGAILLGGDFTTLDGLNHPYLGRLLSNGSLDLSFTSTASAIVYSLVLQADGAMLVGGNFTTLAGQTRNFLGRLGSSGSLDATFNPGANNQVRALALQTDGKLLVGGLFTTLATSSRSRLGRLTNNTTAIQPIIYDGSTVSWQRNGSSPEIESVVFDASMNGIDWTGLGSGSRVAGGWELAGAVAGSNDTIRARAGVVGGAYNGSAYFIEAGLGPPAISIQPQDAFGHTSDTLSFSVVATGTSPLGYQWYKDGVPVTGGTNSWLTLSGLTASSSGSTYMVLVTNALGAVRSIDAHLWVQAADSLNPAPSGSVYAIAIQKDGKVVIGGTFTNIGGVARNNIARLNSNGSVDSAFNPGADGSIWCLALQENGQIIAGGTFGVLAGRTNLSLGRINADGSADQTFSGQINPGLESPYCLALQPDGRVLVGGSFITINGQIRAGIARLNADGSLDSSFNRPPYYPGTPMINAVALEPSGSVLIFGDFSLSPSPTIHWFCERLNTDGSHDRQIFHSSNTTVSGNYSAYAGILQPDGKIVLGGRFLSTNTYLARFNPDASLDGSFSPVLNGTVYSLAVQADGKLLVGGSFSLVNSTSRIGLCRLNPDGTLDGAFDLGTGSGGSVRALALHYDGKLLVGGSFTTLGGLARKNLGRLNNTASVTELLAYDGASIIWQRTGSLSEFARVAFESSSDGINWVSQGSGSPVAGGWQLGGVSLPDSSRLRAHGTVAGSGISSWAMETVTSPLTITNQPASRTNDAGTAAVFQLAAVGTGPLTYQWFKGGVPLADGGFVTGARTRTLMIANVLGWDAGGYSATITNLFGSVTSAVATLTVIDPIISVQPVGANTNAGATVIFRSAATGTTPLSFQWRKGGTNLAEGGNVIGAKTAMLALSNVLGGDAGAYSLFATNAYGSVTSMLAALSVTDPFMRTQPTNLFVNAGNNLTLNCDIAGSSPLRFQWFKNSAPLQDATNATLTFAPVQGTNAGIYSVAVTNSFGSVTGAIATLNVNAASPDTFDAQADTVVYANAVQPDGKILVGGAFTNLAGYIRLCLGRFFSDGLLDTNFNPGATGVNPVVNSLTVESDGKILVAGRFTTLAGQACTNFGRLKSDGTFDSSFVGGADLEVFGSLELPDGKLLVWGAFGVLSGQTCYSLGRLNPNGTLDTNFNAGVSGAVYCVAAQLDGNLLVAGSISALGGQPRNYIGRIDPNGALDTNFQPKLSASVNSLAVQPDGSIVVGGFFTSYGPQTRKYLARLTPDGLLDGAFNPGAAGGCAGAYLYSAVLQTDGGIIVSGGFSQLAGQTRNCIGRLDSNGNLDDTFTSGASRVIYCPFVYSLAVQSDGKLLVGGAFTTLGGQSRGYLGRLNSTAPATQTLTLDGSTISWVRDGTGPEFWRTTFEQSTDGINWQSVGAGIRAGHGWQVSAASIQPNAMIRARGFVSGGYQNSSSWFVESLLQTSARPVIIVSDGGFGFHNGQFGFNLRSTPGQAVIIEASTNLVNWVRVQTNVINSLGLIIFSDAQAGLFRRRFYRAELYQGPLPPPAILARDGSLGFRTNRFGFDLSGIPGQTLVVEVSTNLVNWTALATNILENSALYFSDPASGILPRRFYRARLAP